MSSELWFSKILLKNFISDIFLCKFNCHSLVLILILISIKTRIDNIFGQNTIPPNHHPTPPTVVGFLARYLCKYWVWLLLFWDAEIHLAIDYLTMQLWICGINFFTLFLIWGNFRVILFVLICLIVLFWTPSDAILQVS